MAHLPPEVWRRILRQATYTPDLLATTWGYDAKDRIWEGWYDEVTTIMEQRQALDNDLVAKYNIFRVCRKWREIGTEFLYEVINIPFGQTTNSTRLNNLLHTLTPSAAGSTAPSTGMDDGIGYGYGWWTRRVTLSLLDLSPDHLGNLFTLLEHRHNVRIFGLYSAEEMETETYMRLVRLLEFRFSHSLRRVEIFLVLADSIHPFIIPNIHNLTCLGVPMMKEESIIPPQRHGDSFKHITTLSLLVPSHLNGLPSDWNFTRLENLSLWNVGDTNANRLVPFLERHDATLSHLHIASMSSGNSSPPRPHFCAVLRVTNSTSR